MTVRDRSVGSEQVWAVFAPKLVYDVVLALVADALLLLALLLRARRAPRAAQ